MDKHTPPQKDLILTNDEDGFYITFTCFDPDLSSDYEEGYENCCNFLYKEEIDHITLSNEHDSFTIKYSQKTINQMNISTHCFPTLKNIGTK